MEPRSRLPELARRGLPVDRALNVLQFSPKRAATIIRKVVESAIANAEQNSQLSADELYISKCYADEGLTLRRWRPRARGRATRIRKRTCHLTVIVDRMTQDQMASQQAKEERRSAGRAARVAASRRAQAEAQPEASAPEDVPEDVTGASHDHEDEEISADPMASGDAADDLTGSSAEQESAEAPAPEEKAAPDDASSASSDDEEEEK